MSWLPDDNFREQLLAFADGELPLAEQPALLQYIAENPQAAVWLNVEARRKLNIREALTVNAPAAPLALRQKIEALAVTPPTERRRSNLHVHLKLV